MKKSNILKTIFGATTLLSTAPILATSCNNKKEDQVNENENYIVIAGKKLTIDHALSQADLNAMQPIGYAFSKGVSHKAIFIDGTPYPISTITELHIGNCGDDTLTIPANFLMGGTVSNIVETCNSLQKLDMHGIKTTTLSSTPLCGIDRDL